MKMSRTPHSTPRVVMPGNLAEDISPAIGISTLHVTKCSSACPVPRIWVTRWGKMMGVQAKAGTNIYSVFELSGSRLVAGFYKISYI